MVRNAAFPLMLAILLLLGTRAWSDSGSHWSIDPPFFPHRGRIGVQVEPMTPELRGYFHAPADRGVLVARVESDRPAERAGLRVGDVIVSADGEPVREPLDLIRIVAAAPAGEAIGIGILREAKEQELDVEPEGDPSLWAEPDRLGTWFEEKLHRGSRELRERLEQIERRLEELERKLEERDQETEEAGQET